MIENTKQTEEKGSTELETTFFEDFDCSDASVRKWDIAEMAAEYFDSRAYIHEQESDCLDDDGVAFESRVVTGVSGGIIDVDLNDVHEFDPLLCDNVLIDPVAMKKYLRVAVCRDGTEFDWEASQNVEFNFVNPPGAITVTPSEISTEAGHDQHMIAVEGILSRVSARKDQLRKAAWECQRCGTITEIRTESGDSKPHQCRGCERKGPFRLDESQSEWREYQAVRVETDPSDAAGASDEHVDGYLTGRLCDIGSEWGVLGRAGDRVRVMATIERNEEGITAKEIQCHSVEFPDDDRVDVDEFRYAIEQYASGAAGDPVDLLARSIAPSMAITGEWATAFEFLVAWAFGAPKIEIDGSVERGDIHGAVIGTYGTGKSKVASGLAEILPHAKEVSATNVSDVGLTAAAVNDEFGEGGGWSLEPGVLVEADGGHLILDEIDKSPAALERMNDAIEGKQNVSVAKAGMSATLSSKCGILCMGNPIYSRFDPYEPISDQIDIDHSFLSRMDGIITLVDETNEEKDRKVAEAVGRTWSEGTQFQAGEIGFDELTHSARPVPTDVCRAWVTLGRSIDPAVPDGIINRVTHWYVDLRRDRSVEIRTDNDDDGDVEGKDRRPGTATPRDIVSVIRFTCAFARAQLRNEVTEGDVKRAIDLMDRLVGMRYDKSLSDDVTLTRANRNKIVAAVDELSDGDGAALDAVVSDVAIPDDSAETLVGKLLARGELMEVTDGQLEVTG